MKKILLLFAVGCLSLNSFAQTTQLKTEIDAIKKTAEKWFKDVYVEQFFQDPYSYRLMGIKAIPVTAKESSIQNLSVIQNRIDACTVAESDRTQEQLDMCMKAYEEGRLEMLKEKEFTDKGIDVDYHTTRFEIYKQYALDILNLAKPIELYLLDIKTKEALEQIIENLSQEEANKLAFYDIRLDCYSKNSLGNEVLGRFSFPFTKDGPTGDKNGIDKIIQLNK